MGIYVFIFRLPRITKSSCLIGMYLSMFGIVSTFGWVFRLIWAPLHFHYGLKIRLAPLKGNLYLIMGYTVKKYIGEKMPLLLFSLMGGIT